MIQTRVERLEIPDVLLTCLDSPEPGPISSQRDVADFLIRLWDAGQDCRDKLDAVRRLVDSAPDPPAK